MAVVQTKYVTVGSYSVGGGTLTGFYTGGLSFGTISNTSGGSSATALYSVSSQTTVQTLHYSSFTGALVFNLKGNYAVPSNAGFDTLKIAGNSFSRTAATSTTNTSTKTRTWTWSGASNPFGSIDDAVKTVTWESPTATYTLTAPTSIDEGSSGTINIATTNVSTGTPLYWTVTSTGQFTGSTSGTVTTDSSGNASFSVTPTADSTTEGALTVTARIRTGSQGGTIVASDTFVINDTSTTPANNPNQFTFDDETSVERNAQQTSNLITIAGLTSGTSVSVSITGGTYTKNGGSYATANTTATNGDTFKVRHLSSSAVSTAVNTTLTVAEVSDTYTTTTTSSYCPTTNTAHTITGITTTSTGTLSQTSIVSSNNSLFCSLTTPYNWISSNPSSEVTRSNITSVSVTNGGGSVSLSRTNNSTAHTITYTPPATSTETTATIQIQHRKQTANQVEGFYQWPTTNQGALTTVNITVTICPVSQTTVSITSVDSVTPLENSTDVVTATPVTASGVSISSYAWTTTNSNVISLSSTTAQSPTLTFGNITQNNTVATIGVTVTDSTGATATASQSYSVQFVNQAPVAILNGPGTVTVSTAATMDASDSYDNDGQSLTYQFTATNGGQSFSSGAASSTDTWSFTPTDSNSSYTVTLTVSDGVTTSTATKSVLSVSNANETTTGAGGFGFEVLNASGGTILRGDELLIRKAKVVTANSSGAASTTITGTESGTRIIGMTAGEANTGVEISVTGTTTKTVTLSNALANEKIFLYLLR